MPTASGTGARRSPASAPRSLQLELADLYAIRASTEPPAEADGAPRIGL